MSDAVPLNVLLPPTAAGAAWKRALISAAESKGVRLAFAPARKPLPTGGDWLVLSEPAATLWAGVASAAKTPNRHAGLATASGYLAQVCVAASRGAPVQSALATRLDTPRLGSVERSPTAAPAPTDDPALDIYRETPPAPDAEARWAPHHFHYPAGREVTGGTPAIDITGRVRIMVYGPYAVLPPGRWEIEALFEIDPEGAPSHLRFEWGSGHDLTVADVSIDKPGAYAMKLSHVWSEGGPAELRLWSVQAAFQGRMEFKGAIVRRLPDLASRPADVSA